MIMNAAATITDRPLLSYAFGTSFPTTSQKTSAHGIPFSLAGLTKTYP